jgi:hypothetical protein
LNIHGGLWLRYFLAITLENMTRGKMMADGFLYPLNGECYEQSHIQIQLSHDARYDGAQRSRYRPKSVLIAKQGVSKNTF